MILLNGIRWKIYQGALIPDEPPHINVKISLEEARYLLKISGAYFIRWTNNWDCGYPTEFWYVIKDGKCSMEELSRNTRNQIRKGLKNCVVKKVDGEFIANYGYEVYRKAFQRYKTFLKPVTEPQFKEGMLRFKNDRSKHFWAVFTKKEHRLIAYSLNRVQYNMCDYSTIKLDPNYLKLYPSYALIFEMNKYYLNELRLSYVLDGSRNLSHNTNIQGFLIKKFKFRKAYCSLNIVYSRKVGLALNFLFPLRKFIYSVDYPVFNKVSVLLKHEEIRRSFL